jgi:hypothetical protein
LRFFNRFAPDHHYHVHAWHRSAADITTHSVPICWFLWVRHPHPSEQREIGLVWVSGTPSSTPKIGCFSWCNRRNLTNRLSGHAGYMITSSRCPFCPVEMHARHLFTCQNCPFAQTLHNWRDFLDHFHQSRWPTYITTPRVLIMRATLGADFCVFTPHNWLRIRGICICARGKCVCAHLKCNFFPIVHRRNRSQNKKCYMTTKF